MLKNDTPKNGTSHIGLYSTCKVLIEKYANTIRLFTCNERVEKSFVQRITRTQSA